MTKHSRTVETGPVVDNPLNSFIPGPDREAKVTDDKGHSEKGYGSTDEKATKNAMDKMPKR